MTFDDVAVTFQPPGIVAPVTLNPMAASEIAITSGGTPPRWYAVILRGERAALVREMFSTGRMTGRMAGREIEIIDCQAMAEGRERLLFRYLKGEP